VIGIQVVQSDWSPDGEFEAYVEESPSIDPPNQSLNIQRKDDIHFVVIADLVEDVDSIRDIYWSPDSRLVVFSSYSNLFIVRVPGYTTLKVPLDTEFARYQPGKLATFGGGIAVKKVASISYPRPGVVAYKLAGDDMEYQVDLNLIP
jgi:hypothetical protein